MRQHLFEGVQGIPGLLFGLAIQFRNARGHALTPSGGQAGQVLLDLIPGFATQRALHRPTKQRQRDQPGNGRKRRIEGVRHLHRRGGRFPHFENDEWGELDGYIHEWRLSAPSSECSPETLEGRIAIVDRDANIEGLTIDGIRIDELLAKNKSE